MKPILLTVAIVLTLFLDGAACGRREKWYLYGGGKQLKVDNPDFYDLECGTGATALHKDVRELAKLKLDKQSDNPAYIRTYAAHTCMTPPGFCLGDSSVRVCNGNDYEIVLRDRDVRTRVRAIDQFCCGSTPLALEHSMRKHMEEGKRTPKKLGLSGRIVMREGWSVSVGKGSCGQGNTTNNGDLTGMPYTFGPKGNMWGNGYCGYNIAQAWVYPKKGWPLRLRRARASEKPNNWD